MLEVEEIATINTPRKKTVREKFAWVLAGLSLKRVIITMLLVVVMGWWWR